MLYRKLIEYFFGSFFLIDGINSYIFTREKEPLFFILSHKIFNVQSNLLINYVKCTYYTSFNSVISKSKIYNLNSLTKKECAVEVVVVVSFQTLNDIAYHISANKPRVSVSVAF